MQIQRKGSLSGVGDIDIARPFDKYAILTEVTRLNHDPDSWHRSRSVRARSTGTRNTHGYPEHRAPSRQGYVLRESLSHACGRRRVTAGVFFRRGKCRMFSSNSLDFPKKCPVPWPPRNFRRRKIGLRVSRALQNKPSAPPNNSNVPKSSIPSNRNG